MALVDTYSFVVPNFISNNTSAHAVDSYPWTEQSQALPITAVMDPPAGNVIYANQFITATLTLPPGSTLAKLVILLQKDFGQYEVVFDGEEFTSGYSAYSTLVTVLPTVTASLRKATGWPVNGRIKIFAITDKGGSL